jgi:hypothetical protein
MIYFGSQGLLDVKKIEMAEKFKMASKQKSSKLAQFSCKPIEILIFHFPLEILLISLPKKFLCG